MASAPGKVLIAGGYLVLERPNAGLVLSTTARFYAVVRPLRDSLPADSWTWVSAFQLRPSPPPQHPAPLCHPAGLNSYTVFSRSSPWVLCTDARHGRTSK